MTTQDQPTDMTGPADPVQPESGTGDNRSKGALDEMLGTARRVRLTSRSIAAPDDEVPRQTGEPLLQEAGGDSNV